MGRVDNAFNSGGETVFPDEVKNKYEDFIFKQKMLIKTFQISIIEDELWGNRFEVIISFKKSVSKIIIKKMLEILKEFSLTLPKHERPSKWNVKDCKSDFNNSNGTQNWKSEI